MSQPLHTHLLGLFHRLDLKNLSLLPYHRAICLLDLLRFRDTHCISCHLRYIAGLLVTYMIFVCPPYIQSQQELRNTIFTIVYPCHRALSYWMILNWSAQS